ncbi:MAG: 6-phosphogluconolactonase [Verrucomicrobiales bacterium]
MKQVVHRTFGSEKELAEAAAAEVVKRVATQPNEPFSIALSGGRIAESFYQAIVRQSFSNACSWNHVHFFWADERCVPPDSTDSNYRQAGMSLFVPLRISNENIHRIYGETEKSYAVSQAEAELCRVSPLDGEGMPIIDLVILGMGEDGHTASLFPAEPLSLMSDQAVFRAVVATKPPPNRVTMGYQVLIRAKEAMVLVSGAGKQVMLEKVLSGDEALPLARVINARKQTQFFTYVP